MFWSLEIPFKTGFTVYIYIYWQVSVSRLVHDTARDGPVGDGIDGAERIP